MINDGNFKCACPGDQVSDDSGICSCPGNQVLDGIQPSKCTCPGDQSFNKDGNCGCPGNQFPDSNGICGCLEQESLSASGICSIPEEQVICRDSEEYASRCPNWAKHGECTKSAGFMKQFCKKSCNECLSKNYN